ncbi:hypothetical protein G6011_05700 [Alternaria panax]|uniref:Uncharacterized protein n=1 Tax=Alternaria panax TaxID=48097 RepID=A0AAD4I944_9PLEO|nr:hypothetical protein G6011_05700 [Alternaria panax]
MAIIVAHPDNLQSQSALLQLPAEIKHIIYGLCLVADAPIIDPQIDNSKIRQDGTASTAPGAALLQTCRRTYHEIDRRPLFAQNTFRFSNVTSMRTFLKALPLDYRMRIQDIEIDLRELNSDRPHIAHEWLQYTAFTNNDATNSLRADATGLRCLRINLETWPIMPVFRIELWQFLQKMLSELEGLDRIIVTGASKGKAMGRRLPWSPVHFVGGDDVGAHDLLTRMNKCVTGNSSDNLVRWLRQDGKLQLEVLSKSSQQSSVAVPWAQASGIHDRTDVWPLNGVRSFFACENRYSYGKDSVNKGLNPNVAE